MSRTVRWVMVAVGVQAALVGVYWAVERGRAPEVETLGTAPPVRLDIPLPSLRVRRRDGTRAALSPPARRALVHVWATWCPPCRDELPGLLALATTRDVDVVAISVDRGWAEVDRFMPDVGASRFVLARSEDVERALGVRSLPVTFVLETDGRLTLRFDGARDWTDEDFVRTYVDEPEPGDRR